MISYNEINRDEKFRFTKIKFLENKWNKYIRGHENRKRKDSEVGSLPEPYVSKITPFKFWTFKILETNF